MLGRDAERVLHRGLLRVRERAVEHIGRREQEAARERRRKALEAGIEQLLARGDAGILRLGAHLVARRAAERHAVADRARDAVARERGVSRRRRVRRTERDRVYLRAPERLAAFVLGMTVDRELPLAHDAVAAEA